MAGIVHLNWYSTGLRSDRVAELLTEIAPVAARYGATAFTVHRSREDRHKFLQTATFEDKLDFERYWTGPEFTDWRVIHAGHWQVPMYPVWHDIVVDGRVEPEEVVNAEWTGAPDGPQNGTRNGAPNGTRNGMPNGVPDGGLPVVDGPTPTSV